MRNRLAIAHLMTTVCQYCGGWHEGKCPRSCRKLPGQRLRIAHLIVVGLTATSGLPGCASLLPALGAIAQGAQVLGSALDLARDGSESYFARHPHPEHEQEVGKALRRAQAAVLLLDSAVAAGKGVEKARRDALAAYDNLRVLLYELGVPGAVVPDGGAEDTSAPLPEPFELPETSALQATMD